MTSFPDSIKSSTQTVFNPQEQPSVQSKDYTEKMHHIFTEKSPKPRVGVPVLQRTASKPQPFHGTCAECIAQIKDTVHSTIDNMDFDGLKPFTKIIDLMEKEETPIEECTVDAQNEGAGAICVGMSLTHLKNIHDNHGIEGALAIERDESQESHHAAVIIECQDGLVFIDNRAVPEMRLFSSDSTFEGKNFSITFSPKGISPQLIFNWPENNWPTRRLEYYTDIANGVDVVNKQFMSSEINKFIPVAVYKKDGKPLKDIIIQPKAAKVRLMNYNTDKKDYIKFEDIRSDGSILQQLQEFMGSDFHTSPQDVNNEIVKFVSHVDELKELFT